jgi:L-cysteine desulfidase
MNSELLDLLKKEVIVGTGCTEPSAVAYGASLLGARINDIDALDHVEVLVDAGIFKNALRVGIPGIKERGLEIATALGLVIAQPSEELRILEKVSQQQLDKAKEIVAAKKIHLDVKGNCERLFIEIIAFMKDGHEIRSLLLDRHTNVVRIEEGRNLIHEQLIPEAAVKKHSVIQKHDLESFLHFVNETPIAELAFLKEGLEMNLALAHEGMQLDKGIGITYKKMMKDGIIDDKIATYAETLCSAASEARMSGSQLPCMTCSGSGNHGITVFLTVGAVAERAEISEEKLLRSLALACLATVYVKSYTGTLSAMCGCGVAAGIGATAGVAYMYNATKEEIFSALLNMVGSIAGLICDGGKEGCAYKLALSSGWAVKSAFLAMNGAHVKYNNGILSDNFQKLIENVGYVCTQGMANTNATILDIMFQSLTGACHEAD